MSGKGGHGPATVTFDSVSKVFPGGVRAVDRVSFHIDAGQLVTLLGPSGCGKTTTLRMVAGLELASEGKILIGANDVTLRPATDRDVSMVFQSYALFPHMSVAENVGYGLTVTKVPKSEVAQRVQQALSLVGLPDLGNRLPTELSGGQQQRVAVARALILEPSVILFDEPLSNLDAKLRRRVREEIRELQTSLGLTALYVTHDQAEALAISDRIIVMREAEIAQVGRPEELYEAPDSVFVADFIGDANILRCEIAALDGDIADVHVGPLVRRMNARGLATGEANLAVRPNSVLLVDPDTANTIPGVVRKTSYAGSHLEYFLDTELGEVFAVSNSLDNVRMADESVGLTFTETGPTLVRP